MEKLSVVIIDGSELFAQGIQNQLVQNKIATLSNIFISTHSSNVDLPSNIDLIIVGQACLDNIQFDQIHLLGYLVHNLQVPRSSFPTQQPWL